MNIHIQTRYTKWSGKQWFFDSYRSGTGLDDNVLLWGRSIQIAIAGHVFTLSIHWKKYPQ